MKRLPNSVELLAALRRQNRLLAKVLRRLKRQRKARP